MLADFLLHQQMGRLLTGLVFPFYNLSIKFLGKALFQVTALDFSRAFEESVTSFWRK